MELIRMSVTLNRNGFNTKKIVWQAEEKNKIYVLTRLDKHNENSTRHIKKETLNKMDTINLFNDSTHFITRSATVTVDEVDNIEQILINDIKASALKFKKELDELILHI